MQMNIFTVQEILKYLIFDEDIVETGPIYFFWGGNDHSQQHFFSTFYK